MVVMGLLVDGLGGLLEGGMSGSGRAESISCA